MSNFSLRFKQLRKGRSLSQMELSRQIGISKSSVNMYERGEREPGIDTLRIIADFFQVDMDYLLGKSEHRTKQAWLGSFSDLSSLPDNILPMPALSRVPLLGTIACGAPILAAENLDGEVELPGHIHADFALRCRGDSMINARIFDGDVVYIRQQEQVESGQIAAVLIDDEATLKRVRLFGDHISLEPENPMYKPLVLWDADMARVRILGRAVAFLSSVH